MRWIAGGRKESAMRIRNATRRWLILFATAAVLFSGCGKSKTDAETEPASEPKQESKAEMLEIFVDKDGRIAFPEDFQAEIIRGDFDPDKVEVKYVDDQAVKKRLDELAARLWNRESSGVIKVFKLGDSKFLSAANYIFLNAHPEAKHEDVRRVLRLVLEAGFWDDVTFGTIVLNGKALPLAFSPPARKGASSAGKPDEDVDRIEIQIGSKCGFLIDQSFATLADVDSYMKKRIASSSRDIPVRILCSLESLHRSLIAVLSVCAKHGMSNVLILSQ